MTPQPTIHATTIDHPVYGHATLVQAELRIHEGISVLRGLPLQAYREAERELQHRIHRRLYPEALEDAAHELYGLAITSGQGDPLVRDQRAHELRELLLAHLRFDPTPKTMQPHETGPEGFPRIPL